MTDDQIQTLAGLIAHLDQADGRIHVMRDEIAALRAALALATRRCGNCGHWEKFQTTDDYGECGNDLAMGFGHQTHRRDGCILGWKEQQ